MDYTIKKLKDELIRLQQAQNMCVDENGLVYNHHKYRYKMLVEQTKDLKSSIEYLEGLKVA